MKEIIREMYSEEQVHARILEMAEQINQDYEGKSLHIICVLKGSVFFCCDLVRHLTIPVTIDFMAVSSYGNETRSSGRLRITKDLDEDIDDLDCLIVEDIIDSGNTLKMTRDLLSARNAASMKICTLLDKPSCRETEVKVDYTGFEIPDKFVVGYGLDYAQKYRNLPYIASVEFIEE
ncbi:MAG: hypoxanthine phosphoribosyltransferase [Eubacteriales bacterium]|nr:hypoxanthine phosphoribosyltransferase [Eubacteriales bacterium]